MKAQSFLKHAAVYGVASLLTQAAGFVLLPLYTRVLTTEDYGVLEVLGRIAETAATVLLLGGFRQALFTFYQQAPDETERRRVVSAAYLLAGAACVLGAGLTLLLVQPLCWLFPLEKVAHHELLLTLALFGILLEPFTMLPLAILQAQTRSTRFVLIAFAQFLTLIAVRVVLIVGFGWGVAGVLTGTLLTTGSYAVLLTLGQLCRGAIWPRWETVRGLFRFALPFLPGGLCFFVLQHGDRFFLWRFAGSHHVGIYSLGYKLALAVGTFSLAPLYMVWSARMYDAAERPDAPAVFGRVFSRVLGAFLFVGLGLSLFQDEVVLYLAGPKFAAASLVIAPVVLAGYFQTAAALMDATFYIRRRTSTKLRLTLEATAVMLVLYVALIPPFAGIGAALATLGGFAFLALRTWRTTQRIFEVRYEWPRVAASLAIAVALWGMSRLLPSDGSAFVVRGFLLLTWPVLLWQFGLLTNEEKEYARTSLRRLLSHLRPRRIRPAAPVTPRGDGGTVAAASRPAPARPMAGRPPCPDPTSCLR
jgi:O-antigen/teichoic acid export membrane protein